MVGIVLISHSSGLAQGAADVVSQVAGRARVVPAGGTYDGRIGTSTELIARAITFADQGHGVLLIPDLGSAVLSALSVLADLDGKLNSPPVVIADAPFIEGAVAAAVAASNGLSLMAVAAAAREARGIRKL
jgi:PTS hybrid protein